MQEANHGEFSFGIGITLGVIAVVLVFACFSYTCTRKQAVSSQNNPSTRRSSMESTLSEEDESIGDLHHQGLDEETLRSYPKLLYCQANPYKDDSSASACSICLANYREIDLLRLLPDCGHIFHLNCIDPWLRLHPTCPICRASPDMNSKASLVL